MTNLKATLKKRLNKAKRIALLGVGSKLRCDDAAGILVAEQLEKERRKVKFQQSLKVFIGATAPENLTGEIKRFKPTHLIIIDSADLGKPAGAVQLISADEVGGFFFFYA